VNKKVRIRMKLNKGEVRIRPRIRTSWREENIEYKIPTDMNKRVEDNPCKSMTRTKA